MARHETRHMGDGGEIVIPKNMRDRLGIGPGDEVTFEERADGVVILPNETSGRGSSRSRSTSSGRTTSGRSGRSTSARSSSSRSSRSTSARSSSRPRHAERQDDCF